MAAWEGRKREGGTQPPMGSWDKTFHLLPSRKHRSISKQTRPEKPQPLQCLPHPHIPKTSCSARAGRQTLVPLLLPGGSEGLSRPQTPPYKVPWGPTKSLPWYRTSKVGRNKQLIRSALQPPTLSEDPPPQRKLRPRECNGNDVKTERPVDELTRNRGGSRHLLGDASGDVLASSSKFTFCWAQKA